MRNNNVLGIIFANTHDDYLPELTTLRAMGSVPFGGRYRLIDFPLSNLVNAGIAKVGVVTKSNYHSLMDHIGSGKAWDLSRKSEGLFFLPPMTMDDGLYEGKISTLFGIRSFFRNSKEDYIILTDSYIAGNIDYDRLIDSHVDSGAEITIGYKTGTAPGFKDNLLLSLEESGRVSDLRYGRCFTDECAYGVGLYIMRRDLLTRLIDMCVSRNQTSFEIDILQRNVENMQINGYHISEYVSAIYSPESYFKASMALLDSKVRGALFNPHRPIYTKVRDAAPAKYGLSAVVENTLVADGCYIEGKVKNSIIFRDVRVAKNAVIENSIIMQGCIICENAKLVGTVLDKDVVIRADRTLCGTESFPVFVNKGRVI